MTLIHRLAIPGFRAMLTCWVLLGVSGCASTGFFGDRDRPVGPQDSGLGVPDYVHNLPKSRTGNMTHYTVFGKRYRVMDSAANFTEQGLASWYGKKFHGRKTSSGEVYDMYAMTAAHKHLPLPTYVRVTNLENNRSVVVLVNDRGPFVGDRIIDMSYAAAAELGMVEKGTARVRVDALSTHLVTENDSSSNLNVAKQFDPNKRNAPAPLVPGVAPVAASAPAVIEPQLAAVPLQPPVLAAAQAVTTDQAGSAAITVDGSEDGFVEYTAEADRLLPETPVVLELAAARPSARPSVNSSVGSATNSRGGELLSASKPSSENYFIQLGAFSLAPNAHALVAKVAQQTGLPAFVERDSAESLFRVKIGPFNNSENLSSTLTKLSGIGIDAYSRMAP